MAEHAVKIQDEQGHTMSVSPTGDIHVAMFPEGSTLYGYGISDVPGVVAANNFMTLFNPVGSGKLLTVYRLTVFPWAGGATTATSSLTASRVTAASGGSLVAAANISKFSTASANSIAEVRTANPTATIVGVPITAIPPAITAAAAGVGAVATIQPPTGASFVCQPGEGVVVRTAAGDVDQLWNIFVTWGESPL